MTFSHWTLILTLGVALTGSLAVAQQPDMVMSGQHAPAGEADRAMMSGMQKMNHEMAAAPTTGDADRDFVAMMIPHHRGAVDMAQAELRYGKDPALRKLATDIVAAQNNEIAMMRHWQTTHPVR